MNCCEICKSRYTWDCEEEIETGRTKCADFDLDLSAFDDKDREQIQNFAIAYLLMMEEQT